MPRRHPALGPVVAIRGAGMENVRIAQELDVADLEHHVQLQPVTHRFQHVGRLLLARGQGRHEPGVGEARQGAHKVRIPLGVDPALASGFEEEDGGADPRLLAGGDLALPVEVPDGLGEEVGDVRALRLQRVPDQVGGGDVALAAVGGARDAQQADDVGVVGVEELARVGAVDAHFVDRARVFAQVLDVAEDVAAAVLRDRVADVGGQPHVGDGALVQAPGLHGEVLEEDEAFAVQEFGAHGAEEGGQGREGEGGGGDGGEWGGGGSGDEGVGGGGEFGDLGRGEGVGPALGVVGVG